MLLFGCEVPDVGITSFQDFHCAEAQDWSGGNIQEVGVAKTKLQSNMSCTCIWTVTKDEHSSTTLDSFFNDYVLNTFGMPEMRIGML